MTSIIQRRRHWTGLVFAIGAILFVTGRQIVAAIIMAIAFGGLFCQVALDDYWGVRHARD